MNNFFRDGLAKLLAGGKEQAPAPPRLPPYEGRLSAKNFQLSDSVPLGLGAVVPQTLAHEPRAQLVAVCVPEGHVRLFGQDAELCLRNPEAPVHPQFLLFPRPGLLLLLGVATVEARPSSAGRAAAPAARAGWVAQWWDLRPGAAGRRPGGPSGIGPPQLAALRFGVTCVSSDEASGLVFLGTDEGDVRVFDAGEQPHVGAYCIPGGKLRRAQGREAEMQLCPITALASAPDTQASAELLVATAEGSLVLWSFEKHRAIRFFDTASSVCSLIWHPGGCEFLAASRSDISMFSKSGSAPLLKVPLPGGNASSVALLSWDDEPGHGVGSASQHSGGNRGVPVHGQVILRRGAPCPQVLCLGGSGWQAESLLAEAQEDVVNAIVCMPHRAAEPANDPSSSFSLEGGVPCGLMSPPALLLQGASPRSGSQYDVALQRLAKVPLLLIALGDSCTHFVVQTLPPAPSLAWPASWGSLELVGATALQMVPKSIDASATPTGPSPPAPPEAAHAVGSEDLQKDVQLAGVQEGCLVGGAVALPLGRADVDVLDGWLICTQGEDEDAANGKGEDLGGVSASDIGKSNGEGVQCDLPADAEETSVACEVSLGLDAKAALLLSSSLGLDVIVFDAEEQQVRFSGPCLGAASPIDGLSSLEPGIEHIVLVQSNSVGLSVLWDGAVVVGPIAQERNLLSALSWKCVAGELRIRSVTPHVTWPSEPSPPQGAADAEASPPRSATPPLDQLAEAMFSRRLAHFAAFANGAVEPEPEAFGIVHSWCTMVGGWQGLLCTGHRDGTVRLWLRAHSSVLLLHTLSVRPLAPLPWRPRLAAAGAALEAAGRGARYDGVDACPAVAVEEPGEGAQGQVTAVVFDPALGALAAGTSSSCIVLFLWSDTPQPISAVELAEWSVQGLVAGGDSLEGQDDPTSPATAGAADAAASQGDDGDADAVGAAGVGAGSTADPASSGTRGAPMLPAGFACVARHRQHHAPVHLLRIVPMPNGGMHIVSADAASCFCVMDGLSGEVLFAEALDGRMAAGTGLGGAPGPPPETVEGVALAAGVLHSATAPPVDGHVQMPAFHEVAAPAAATSMGGAYILALSSGATRQLPLPSMRLLDSRIRETRLPDLPGGPILEMHLEDAYLLAVQPAAAHVFERRGALEVLPPYSSAFLQRAIAAGVARVDGELCLLAMSASLAIQVLALPSLHLLATLDASHHAGDLGLGPLPNCFFGLDGYFVLCSRGSDGATRLWWASGLAATCALDEAARVVPAAQIAQALAPPLHESPKLGANGPTGGGQRSGGLFSAAASLFGGGPKSLRECAAPATGSALPAEVDAARVDRGRGLPPAWRDPRAVPKPPPPGGDSRASSAAASASSTHAELREANRRAMERGEKLSELGAKSQKMADDAANFLDLAKQLNARQQNRWF